LTGSSQTYGVGGAGGTGNSSNVVGANGAANTGNGGVGGGGTSSGAAKSGGAGGSGLVVVRYEGSQAGTGGTISAGSGSAAGYTLHTFTSTGTNALNLSGLNLDTRLKTTLTGVISGSGNLTYNGPGTLSLAAANTYTGATAVNQGSLAVNGSLGNTAVSVGSNATLQGSGSIGGSVTINSLGTLSAGNSIESLAMGTLTLQSGSNFIQEVDSSATVGSQADLVVVNGNLNIANGTTTLTLTDLAGAWNWVNDTKFTMINYNGSWNGGLFVMDGDVLEDDSNIIIADGKGWRINYNDTTGGSNYSSEQTYSKFVTLTAVPEPTVVTLGGLGALLLLRRRRA
jgi:MYXO-CTERM domain-containing protein